MYPCTPGFGPLFFFTRFCQTLEDSDEEEAAEKAAAAAEAAELAQEAAAAVAAASAKRITLRQPSVLEQKIMAAARERQRANITKKQVGGQHIRPGHVAGTLSRGSRPARVAHGCACVYVCMCLYVSVCVCGTRWWLGVSTRGLVFLRPPTPSSSRTLRWESP